MSKAPSIIYVDGFNLYYGAVKDTRYKLLDLELLFRRLRPGDDIQAIHYFTALVEGSHRPHQLVYLNALSTLPLVNIILGKFKRKRVQCRVPDCTYQGSREFGIPEEKRTDVNMALQMLDDAYQNRADRFVVVSGDSDLVPALTAVKRISPMIQITVYVPARNPVRGAAVELRAVADKDKTLPFNLVKKSQFPPILKGGPTGQIVKPADW